MSLKFGFTDPSGAAVTWRLYNNYLGETPSSRHANFSTNGHITNWGTHFKNEPIAQAGIQGLAFNQYTSDHAIASHELSPYINDPLRNIGMLNNEGVNPNPLAGSNHLTNALISPGGNPMTWSALSDIDIYYRIIGNPYRPGDPLSPQYALAMKARLDGDTFMNPESNTTGIQRPERPRKFVHPRYLAARGINASHARQDAALPAVGTGPAAQAADAVRFGENYVLPPRNTEATNDIPQPPPPPDGGPGGADGGVGPPPPGAAGGRRPQDDSDSDSEDGNDRPFSRIPETPNVVSVRPAPTDNYYAGRVLQFGDIYPAPDDVVEFLHDVTDHMEVAGVNFPQHLRNPNDRIRPNDEDIDQTVARAQRMAEALAERRRNRAAFYADERERTRARFNTAIATERAVIDEVANILQDEEDDYGGILPFTPNRNIIYNAGETVIRNDEGEPIVRRARRQDRDIDIERRRIQRTEEVQLEARRRRGEGIGRARADVQPVVPLTDADRERIHRDDVMNQVHLPEPEPVPEPTVHIPWQARLRNSLMRIRANPSNGSEDHPIAQRDESTGESRHEVALNTMINALDQSVANQGLARNAQALNATIDTTQAQSNAPISEVRTDLNSVSVAAPVNADVYGGNHHISQIINESTNIGRNHEPTVQSQTSNLPSVARESTQQAHSSVNVTQSINARNAAAQVRRRAAVTGPAESVLGRRPHDREEGDRYTRRRTVEGNRAGKRTADDELISDRQKRPTTTDVRFSVNPNRRRNLP